MVLKLDIGKRTERLARLLWMDDAGIEAALIDIDNPKARVCIVECKELENALVAGKAAEAKDPYGWLRWPSFVFSAARRRERDQNYAAMRELVDALPAQQFDRKWRGQAIKRIAARDPHSPLHRNKSHAYSLWRRWCQRGEIPNAFLSDRDKAGWTKEQRQTHVYTARPGRRHMNESKEQTRKRFIVTKRDADILFQIGVLFYRARQKNGKRRTWKQALQLGCETFYCVGWRVDEHGTRTPIMPPKRLLPSVRQFRHHYLMRSGLTDDLLKRYGKKRFNRKHRPLTGDQRSLATRPLELVQLDTQTAKVYLINPINGELAGRPTITMARCTATRLICGFCLSWEFESSITYLLTFENLMRDKVEYCASLGFEISPEDWPCHHYPAATLSDNGPDASRWVKEMKSGLDINAYNTGGSRPDMKPVIESGFDDLNDKLIFLLPGAVLTESEEPDADPATKRYKEQARLTLRELERLIVNYIIDYNARVLEEYPLTDAQRRSRVLPVPKALWHWAVKNSNGRLRPADPDTARLHCLQRGKARVTRKGIVFKGKTYECQSGLQGGWHEKASLRAWDIEVFYDPRNLECIYIRKSTGAGTEEGDVLEPCTRNRSIGEAIDIALADIVRADHAHSQFLDELQQDEPQRKADYNAAIDKIVKPARARKASPKVEGQSLRNNRHAVRDLDRQQIHPVAPLTPLPDSSNLDTLDDELPDDPGPSGYANVLSLIGAQGGDQSSTHLATFSQSPTRTIPSSATCLRASQRKRSRRGLFSCPPATWAQEPHLMKSGSISLRRHTTFSFLFLGTIN
jgi:hypothetical protein